LVAVSIVPEKTFVKAVCGDLADVAVMVPPGGSPTNYEPTPGETEMFSRAEVYFSIGIPAESANIMPLALEKKDMKIVRLEEEVAKVYPDREIYPGLRDPHIWLSPKRVVVIIEIIAREMASVDPANKEIYEKNAQQYIFELKKLDETIKADLGGLENREFIVFHPAFGYLADDYDLQMYALEQGGKEATPQHIKEMVDFARKENIKVIYYQAGISGRQVQSFAEEIGAEMIQLDPLAADYIENIRKMTTLIAEGLK